MPEINPLTNNQIFLKKIAENTGSEYETGDVSEINPLTIDQIFLKEIAANTAGQSGDISELEGKVADNTAAIEAIVNEYGAKNLAPTKDIGGTQAGLTVTMNSDGSITFHAGISTNTQNTFIYLGETRLIAGEYYYSGGLPTSFNDKIVLLNHTYGPINDSDQLFIADGSSNYGMMILIYPQITLSQDVTFYPMLRDARITDPTYAPYAMTNRELTERVSERYVSVMGDGVKTHQQLLNDLYTLVDRSKLSKKSRFSLYYNQAQEWICSLSFISANKLQYDGITGGDATTLTAYHWELSSTLADCKRVDYTMTSSGLTVTDGSFTIPGATNEYRVYY